MGQPLNKMRKATIIKARSTKQLAKTLSENSVVSFSFVKRNGDLRQVSATTKNTLIPKELRASSSKSNGVNSVRFFDLGINAWRSVSADSPIYMG
jgi:hypothetical protein